MAVTGIQQTAEFIARFRSFDAAMQNERFEQFCADFKRLQTGLAPLQAQAAAEQRRTAGTFNIFRLLGVAHDEVRTHSALLANLLDPHGSHAQGTLFLERFLICCNKMFPELPAPSIPITAGRWTVRTEFMTPQGILDIVLSSSRLSHLYVIENKVWAMEQTDQLTRYDGWLKQQSQYAHRALFYLTPDGRPSLTSGDAPYYRLSYRAHIVPWLEETLAEVEAPHVVETLKQYLKVINDL